MKKQLNFTLSILMGLTFILGTATSCNRKGCTDSVAENFSSKAKKDDGTCTYARTKFIGTFSTNETCTFSSDSYPMTVTESSTDKTKVIIFNIYGAGESITGTVSGSTVTFNQTVSGSNVSGTGTLSGSTLTINYSITESGVVETCTAIGIKQ